MSDFPKEVLTNSLDPIELGKRLSDLENGEAFPRKLENVRENLIINICKEQRWSINPASDNVPSEFQSKELLTSTQSLGRIDEVTRILDKVMNLSHSWSRMVTYIDLVKVLESSVQIRLRYEFTANQLTVKWIVVDTASVEDKVFVLIAENDEVIEQWEQKFLELPQFEKKISIKVFKHFLVGPEGDMMTDYTYTELDNDRLEGDLDSKRLSFKITKNFAGVFVQDRFSLPVVGEDADGLLDFVQVIDLIKNELKVKPDKLAVLSQFNLHNEEIRVELETHVEESVSGINSPLVNIANALEKSFRSAEELNILTKNETH